MAEDDAMAPATRPDPAPGTGEDVCPAGTGSGRVEGAECPECGGTGRVVEG